MGIKSLATFFKKEELQQPVPAIFNIESAERQEIQKQTNRSFHPKEETETDDFVMEEFVNGFNLDNNNDDDAENIQDGQLNYWERLMMPCDEDAGKGYLEKSLFMCFQDEDNIKKDPEYALLEDDDEDGGDEKRLSLNLSLNYQEVLDAWSDRTLWADNDDDSSFFPAPNNANNVMGEVAAEIEEEGEGRKRREAIVMRYKEKRQTRLFSKKIRYQVRKLNADQRPRLKVII